MWAVEALRENNKVEDQNRTVILANHRKLYDECLQRMNNLMAMYIAPNNLRREFLSDSEYLSQKNGLTADKARIEAEMRRVESSVDEWMDLTEKTFKFATYAKAWFDKGDYEIKTQVLQAIGANHVFFNGVLDITLEKPFLKLKEGLESEPLKSARCELPELLKDKRKNRRLAAVISHWSGIMAGVRNFWQTTTERFYIPSLSLEAAKIN